MSDEKEILDLYERARTLVRRVKNTMRLVYQLAFIVTSEAPESKEAEKLLRELVERGIITEAQMWKAISDVERWRKRVLDKIFYDDYEYYERVRRRRMGEGEEYGGGDEADV